MTNPCGRRKLKLLAVGAQPGGLKGVRRLPAIFIEQEGSCKIEYFLPRWVACCMISAN